MEEQTKYEKAFYQLSYTELFAIEERFLKRQEFIHTGNRLEHKDKEEHNYLIKVLSEVRESIKTKIENTRNASFGNPKDF